MKKQILKRLVVFIAMMFSITFLFAQCPGNKVQMFKPTRVGTCHSRCVPQSQVQKYWDQGWRFYCSVSPFFGQSKNSFEPPITTIQPSKKEMVTANRKQFEKLIRAK